MEKLKETRRTRSSPEEDLQHRLRKAEKLAEKAAKDKESERLRKWLRELETKEVSSGGDSQDI